jgi:hypothetical protein
VRAATGFNGADAIGFKGLMFRQELGVFFGENVIGYNGDARFFPQRAAKLEHQGGLPTAHRSADTNREGTLAEIAVERQLALLEVTGMVRMVVRVAVAVVRVKMEKEICCHRSLALKKS